MQNVPDYVRAEFFKLLDSRATISCCTAAYTDEEDESSAAVYKGALKLRDLHIVLYYRTESNSWIVNVQSDTERGNSCLANGDCGLIKAVLDYLLERRG